MNKNLTIVTGLWNINRVGRDFNHYIESFKRLIVIYLIGGKMYSIIDQNNFVIYTSKNFETINNYYMVYKDFFRKNGRYIAIRKNK